MSLQRREYHRQKCVCGCVRINHVKEFGACCVCECHWFRALIPSKNVVPEVVVSDSVEDGDPILKIRKKKRPHSVVVDRRIASGRKRRGL